jgi:hypothetical protein
MAVVTLLKAAAALVLLLAARVGSADLAEIEQRGSLRVGVGTGNQQALCDLKAPSFGQNGLEILRRSREP